MSKLEIRILAVVFAITINSCIAQDQQLESIEITADDGLIIYGYEFKSPGNVNPVILLFHQAGSNAQAEYRKFIIPHLRNEGFDVIAIDQRKGGSSLGGLNRTVAQVDEGKLSYCDAYPDLIATLMYAKQNFNNGIFIWGSSYSAALVYKLATDYPEDVIAVLAFSPASGKPMGDCGPNQFIEHLQVPSIAFRPGQEANYESVQNQMKLFKSYGIETYVAPKGVHGSSMLNPERAEGVEDTWKVVMDFLKKSFRLKT